MSLITKNDLSKIILTKSIYESAKVVLEKQVNEFSYSKTYDIFMSHSYLDAEVILRVKQLIEEIDFTVYVDWVEDKHLDRVNVNKNTAYIIKSRMGNCKSLFYVDSSNAPKSKWMPWELGYFDGLKNRVAILPIVEKDKDRFNGQEYLGLYPYVDKTTKTLWVNEGAGKYKNFRDWLNGEEIK